jgi:PAS domain S-box-containing protein
MALDDSRLKLFLAWRKAALFGAAYFLCAGAGSFLSARHSPFVTFWLPAGLFLAVLLSNPSRDWPWLALAVLPANLEYDLLYGTKFEVILFFYCANTVQALTGAWLVRKFVAERPTLATLKEFFGLVGCAAIFSAMLGAVIGSATLIHFDFSHSFGQSWKIWWGSNAMAILVLTPFILVWFPKSNGAGNVSSPPKKITEAVLLFLGLGLYVWYLLASDKGIMSPNKSLAIPFLLWAGLRFGPRGATAAGLFLSLTLAFFTTQFSIGLTPAQIATGDYIFPLQTVLAMASLVALIPAIVISERNRTLSELGESEERFKNLSAAAFEGICISHNGRVLDVNNQFLAMFGYERSEVIGRKIIELVAPESRALVAEAVRSGRETIYEHRLLRKDGTPFFAEAQAKMVHAGGQTLRMTALRDITNRKHVEQALLESEEKFSKAFQASPDGICITELESGRFMEVNEGYCRIFNYTREELIGHSAAELGIFEQPEARLPFVQAVRNAGSVRDMELTTYGRGRRKILVHVSAECIELGTHPCIVSVIHDVTERKRTEAERDESIAREAQARADYTFQLIASQEAERMRIARELHDGLSQNLLLIKNRAHLQMAGAKLSEEVREEFQGISNIASQAIAEVRQISRDLHPHQLDLLGLTRALRALIDNADESSEIDVSGKFDSADDLFPRESATNVYRIVQESLNNILKHSCAKAARISLERDVHEVQLRIEDDGCGFKAGRNGGGKGLGLKNIAERVRMLGGKMKLDSQPGNGTRIEITIPISAEHG